MARRKKAKKKELPKIDGTLYECAREVGFIDEQIEGMNPESLKAQIIQIKPELGARLYPEKQVEPAPAKAKEYEIGIFQFEVLLLPGYVPMSALAAKEQHEIERELRRNGIPYMNILEMTIERNMVKNVTGRLVSSITVKYRKEK